MKPNPRIKVCGITRAEDAAYAEAIGVDALGFVFVAASKRAISVEAAAPLCEALGPFVQRVGLFLNSPETDVEHALDTIPGLLPQFHGQETPDYCESFGRPYLKAIGIGSGMPAMRELEAYRSASGFLFDSNEAGQLGGTGHTFDWNLLRSYSGKPLILAGGLNPDNVASAVAEVQPYGVDVSTGVESDPGIKSDALVNAFVKNARSISF